MQGVSYRVELVVPSEKVAFSAREPTGEPAPPPRRTIALRHLEAAGASSRRPSTGATRCRWARVSSGPAVIREGLSTTLVCRGQLAHVGRFGEIVIERGGGS